ncbi:MAG: hypothetical protein Q8R91_04370 [Candidatus Omnitrophota bacterium]|nr:hypothetical protein [Candidatus Omnitrophota bacterium]
MHLTRFFQTLETNFPLSGVRSVLAEKIGTDLVSALERARLLSVLRVADTYPCPQPGGEGCPRHVVETEHGSYVAVCGNDLVECGDVRLTLKEVELLGIVPLRLLEELRSPLKLGGTVREMAGLAQAYQVGFFIPRPAIKHPIYFLAAASAVQYAAVLEALRSRAEGGSFAVIIPTDRFLAPETARQFRTLGIPVISLADTIRLSPAGTLEATTNVLDLFAAIGRRTAGPATEVFAEVLTAEGWKSFTEKEYRDLASTAGRYQIFADERARTACKLEGRKRKSTKSIQPSFFRMLRKAAETSGRFDPNVNGLTEEQLSGKQVFQRARQAIDLKRASGWALFKTEQVDDHAEYLFRPDADVEFALIFLPKS